MKKVLKWFAPLLFVGVTIFLIFFLISINNDDISFPSIPLEKESIDINHTIKKNWLNHFSKAQRQGYFYPVNEIYIKVDVKE